MGLIIPPRGSSSSSSSFCSLSDMGKVCKFREGKKKRRKRKKKDAESLKRSLSLLIRSLAGPNVDFQREAKILFIPYILKFRGGDHL